MMWYSTSFSSVPHYNFKFFWLFRVLLLLSAKIFSRFVALWDILFCIYNNICEEKIYSQGKIWKTSTFFLVITYKWICNSCHRISEFFGFLFFCVVYFNICVGREIRNILLRSEATQLISLFTICHNISVKKNSNEIQLKKRFFVVCVCCFDVFIIVIYAIPIVWT